MSKEKQIAMPVIFKKATTTVDGGWSVSFDVDSSQADNITKIAAMRDEMLYLVIVDQNALK